MRMRTVSLWVLILVPIALSACIGPARRNEARIGLAPEAWDKLGERRVRMTADHDVIPVTYLQGRFRKLMLVVHGSDLEMYDVVVTFANGERFSPATRLLFREDTRSRVIDLPGGRRTVRKVAFSYRSRNALTGFAEVELWGRR